MAKRFQSMPSAEITHRLKEVLIKRVDKYHLYRPLPLPEHFFSRDLPTFRFPVSLKLSPATKQSLESDVSRLVAGHLELLGTVWPNEPEQNWGMDPSGIFWPIDISGHNIDFRHKYEDLDVKFVWERLRLQDLQLLAWSAATGNSAARTVVKKRLNDWLDYDYPFRGIAYGSGIECACRVISLLVICQLIDDFSVAEKRRIWHALHHHACWIRRYPSLYSSANNHRVAELTALVALGVLAPDLPGANPQADLYELSQIAKLQFHDDGVGTEQSAHYQAFTMEWLALASVVASSAGFIHALNASLLRGAGFLHSIIDSRGFAPVFGDVDDSCVVKNQMSKEQKYLCSVTGLIAGITQNTSLLPTAWEDDLRSHLLGIGSLSSTGTPASSKHFAEGGYTVFHCDETMLLFDHGPVGFPSTGGHGHADALALWMHHRGVPMWIDWGSHSYNLNETIRAWSRGTSCHNTLTIDGENQSKISGPFNWAQRAQSKVLQREQYSVVAQHDGYHRSKGVIHQRHVSINAQAITITDSLLGRGEHFVAIRFLLSSHLSVQSDENGWLIFAAQNQIASFHCANKALSPKLYQGAFVDKPGGFSPHYNGVQACSCLSWEGVLATEQAVKIIWQWHKKDH